MTVHELHPDAGGPPSWWADALHHLAEKGPISAAELAAAVGQKERAVERLLQIEPRPHETDAGWVDLRTLADGAVFTHVVTEPELEAGRLDAEDDLILWSRLADDDLALQDGGVLRAERNADLITVLTGPEGWLADLAPDDLVALRLNGGTIEVSRLTDIEPPTPELAERVPYLVEAAAEAAMNAVAAFAREPEVPAAAMLDEVIGDILADRPDTFADPLPPLNIMLHSAALELAGPLVSIAGAPRDHIEVVGLTPEEIVRFTMVRNEFYTFQPDRDLSDVLEHLTTSEPLLDRIADDAEREPLDEDLLAALERAADGPAQRAAGTLLAARSAEGDGRPDDAAELVEKVLTHAAGLEPALRDAADYAATRGEYAQADKLLRDAGYDPDEDLRRQLHPLLAPPRGITARNSPCPCGSGKKYKLCHLRSEGHPLKPRAMLLYGLLVNYARRAANRDHIIELVQASDPRIEMFCTDLALFELEVALDFLDERRTWLREDERDLLERWLRARLGLYEVVSVRRGEHVVVRALPDGEPITLRDRALSSNTERLDVMLARVLDDGTGPALFTDPLRVDRMRREEMLRLLPGRPDPYAIAGFFGPRPLPRLTNQEGHELLVCAASYEVRDARAWDRLAASLDAEGPDALIAMDGDLIRGSVRRDGPQWTVETNSLERLRELQRLLIDAAPDARLISESSVPAERFLDSDQAPLPGPSIPPEEQARVLEEVMREHERRWIDESIPALGGHTPRDAVTKGGPALADLNALLDDFEWTGRQEGGTGMSAQRIRDLLGLKA